MEEGLKYLTDLFALPKQDLRTYSPLTLAYIGDGAYEIIVQDFVGEAGKLSGELFAQKSKPLVKAGTQSAIIQKLEPMLTEEEYRIYKRGRNAHSPTMAKHASMTDYRRATGFEALIGYLYLKEEWKRMLQLIREGISDQLKN